MPHLAIVGGSVVGSPTALLFARAGWQVTLPDPDVDSLTDLPDPVRVLPRRRTGRRRPGRGRGRPAIAGHRLDARGRLGAGGARRPARGPLLHAPLHGDQPTTATPQPGFLAAYEFPSRFQFCCLGDNRTAIVAANPDFADW